MWKETCNKYDMIFIYQNILKQRMNLNAHLFNVIFIIIIYNSYNNVIIKYDNILSQINIVRIVSLMICFRNYLQ